MVNTFCAGLIGHELWLEMGTYLDHSDGTSRFNMRSLDNCFPRKDIILLNTILFNLTKEIFYSSLKILLLGIILLVFKKIKKAYDVTQNNVFKIQNLPNDILLYECRAFFTLMDPPKNTSLSRLTFVLFMIYFFFFIKRNVTRPFRFRQFT